MNLTVSDGLLEHQRPRFWNPLITQQHRLRHVHQILGLNFPHSHKESYYYTLHSTTMSAPFYTSEKVECSNPKWNEIDQRKISNLAANAVVLRVWRVATEGADVVAGTWGVNFSGLVHLGSRIVEMQPSFFNANTVIFNIKGGFFTSGHAICLNDGRQPPFIHNVNWAGDEDKHIYKKTSIFSWKNELRNSYNITKLRKLHSLQIAIKNCGLDVQGIKDKIEDKLGINPSDQSVEPPIESSPSTVRYAPQLLTMRSVNKMLEQKPTRVQRIEMERMRKELEIEQFRAKLLSQERDKKSALIRRYKSRLKETMDTNEQNSLSLMDAYYKLSKETEVLNELKQSLKTNQIILQSFHHQLQQRRRQLMQQLLFIYPIVHVSEQKFTIHGTYVPNSDLLSDCSDTGLSVAFGYITHILLMLSSFLQVPLRYPMLHYGSRSSITDHISNLPERERDFPLFTKGKDRAQFSYAVYLLNKNIAQLRWSYFMTTPDLKATLPNLLGFLEGKGWKEPPPLVNSELNLCPETINLAAKLHELPKKYNLYKISESGPGLSEILAIPEAYMNKLISSESFKNYIATKNCLSIKESRAASSENICDTDEVIEQGTDLLDPSVNLSDLEDTCHEEEDKEESVETKSTGSEQCTVQSIESPLMARTDALLTTKSFNLVKPRATL